MLDDELADKIREEDEMAGGRSFEDDDLENIRRGIIDKDGPIEQGHINTCKDFTDKINDNTKEGSTDGLYQQYLKDSTFSGTFDEYKKIHGSDKIRETKSNGTLIKHSVSISIKKENDQIISKFDGSSVDGPIVENLIAATLGHCPKNGDFFNFTFNMEEDGSVNVNMHVPANNSTKTLAVAENWIKDDKIKMTNDSLPIPVSLLRILAIIGAVTNDDLKSGVASLAMVKNPMSHFNGMPGSNGPYPKNPWGNLGI